MTVPFLLKRAPAGPMAKPCCCLAPPVQRESLGAAGKPFCSALSQKREPGDSGSFSRGRERCFSLNSILGTQKWESGETSRGRFEKHIQGAFSYPLLSLKVLVTQSRQLFSTPWTVAHQAPLSMESSRPTRLLCPWNPPGKNTGAGCHSLLQGIFLSKGSNPGLLHCRQILYR